MKGNELYFCFTSSVDSTLGLKIVSSPLVVHSLHKHQLPSKVEAFSQRGPDHCELKPDYSLRPSTKPELCLLWFFEYFQQYCLLMKLKIIN